MGKCQAVLFELEAASVAEAVSCVFYFWEGNGHQQTEEEEEEDEVDGGGGGRRGSK